ncbi:DUF2911 domain-containing protein [Arenibacter palladensis]|uniref:DUF2911 domain-containing protein n=1 Tax=Arenibacter palladensis TaxID=237373 RepID=UPI0026E37D8C|nr:DUF2911 domain-containing protein [Arenibacter palladensis]MDO6602656.1 DUF2911 domain-containing protein [Arenibacter palladensis]
MKKIALFVFMIAVSFGVQSQISTPAASPSSTLIQKVGLTDVKLEYSRPSMRGRTIFGDLVPYDKLWRTGANARTKITFSENVKIDNQELKAGSYAIYTKPGATSWEVMFYTEADGGGTPATWDESKVAAKTTAQVQNLPFQVETFTISIDGLSDNGATLGMYWSDVYVGVKFDVPTDKAVTSAIEKVMKGPDANDYYSAAVYYMNADKDINKAKEWMDKAMSMTEKPAFWQLRQQSLIYAKAGDKKQAIETAKKSLAAAEAAGNDDYIKMNKDSLKEWGSK